MTRIVTVTSILAAGVLASLATARLSPGGCSPPYR